ncbi:MAG: KUP/HAK/KT family potassium transporter [Sphingobacteriales bacterium]|jgi:KUP system potassium uptake protein|nr:KUP/HAK/KT family potassium transporter [Sphingobacteriales bacterium]
MATSPTHHKRVTGTGLLVTLGVIYGDIGTSPLYVMRAIVGNRPIEESLVLGGLSCVFWTLTLLTSFKYISLLLKADNKGEGGIFALFAKVRKLRTSWLAFPAMLGGAALLADAIIGPPISVASAVQGLEAIQPGIPTIPIVIGILAGLFFLQQFGTRFVGRFFGPIMLVWFSMLFIMGLKEIISLPSVLKAINPIYAAELLAEYPGGFWILGAVFLCTTGADALYSDLGHCGRNNIRSTWPFVKAALIANYFGQGAWLLNHGGETLGGAHPFFAIMPDWFLFTGIIIATAAAIVASQAIISGTFTLINEGMRLGFLPKGRIEYPTDLRGQIYIPTINWLMCGGCIGILLYFKNPSSMEAAYGLSIILTMLCTTVLLLHYLKMKRFPRLFNLSVTAVLLSIETAFLIANLNKFETGGFITLLIAAGIISVMWVLREAGKIKNALVEFEDLAPHFELIKDISSDESIPKFATHLVFLTSAPNERLIEKKILYSIMQKHPKRADVYWLVHVDVTGEPYTCEYNVRELVNDKIVYVRFRIGFRNEPRIDLLLRQVVQELTNSHEVDVSTRYGSLSHLTKSGDFTFVVIEKFLSYENTLDVYHRIILNLYFFIKRLSLSEVKAFGLDSSSVLVEKVPLIVTPSGGYTLKRIA